MPKWIHVGHYAMGGEQPEDIQQKPQLIPKQKSIDGEARAFSFPISQHNFSSSCMFCSSQVATIPTISVKSGWRLESAPGTPVIW